MAGIGFELKKLFIGRGVIRKLRAYAFAGVICSGTMLLAILLLLSVQGLAEAFGANREQRDVLVSVIVYALFISMLLTSMFQTFLSRYVADMLYQGKNEKIFPSLIGASLVLMVPGGLLFGWMISTASALSLLEKVLGWTLFMVLVPTWLQMSYITAAKDYRSILAVFALGVVLALGLGVGLLMLGIGPITALLSALVAGYGVMLSGFMKVLLHYFPVGSGSAFSFISWLSRTPDLLLTGFLSMAGAFVHIVVMWFSPLGMSVTGVFRQASTFDAAAFYAFLVTIPTNINFIVSVEVNFYSKYRKYFDDIVSGGSIGQIQISRDAMITVLKQEIIKLSEVQVFFMAAYVIIMRYFLPSIGFTSDMIAMVQVMAIGYSAFCLGNCVMLLQLYFNDRMGALMTCAVFFTVNTLVSLWTLRAPPLYYGVGIAVAGLVMYVIALLRLMLFIRHVDYQVFCSQPVINSPNLGFWMRLAGRLDARAEQSNRKRHAVNGAQSA